MSESGKGTMVAPRFEGLPTESLADETVRVRLTGLAPGEQVTIRSRHRDDFGNWWEAASAFRVDDRGTVDLATQAPESGSYDGVEPMGFLWSMTPAGPGPASPMMTTTVEPNGRRTDRGGRRATGRRRPRLVRRYLAPGVKRVEVRDDGLLGTFFVPAGEGPFPTIVLLSGSGGGLSEPQAALYASHGYAALALAYFRAGRLPDDLMRIPLEYFETAIAWLQARPEVDAERLAVGGGSRGGELSLLLGSRYPQFKAVVSTVPSSVVYGGVQQRGGRICNPPGPTAARPCPFFASRRGRAEEPAEEPGVGFALTPLFLRSLEDEEAVREATIPVERINGPVILISGNDDAMWPSTRYSEMVMERLAEHGHPYPDQHLALRRRRPHHRPTVGLDDGLRQHPSGHEDPVRLRREPERLGRCPRRRLAEDPGLPRRAFQGRRR